MKVIGVTGTSGSGKTEISKILVKKFNAYLIDADEVAKQFSNENINYLEEITKEFGEEILDENNKLKRKTLADIIYDNVDKRRSLNFITYKYIVSEIRRQIEEKRKETNVVVDAPLLFETNLDELCDLIIGVIANNEIKIERICKRDGMSKLDAIKRLKSQKDNEFFKQNCDYIIENNYKKIENLNSVIEEGRI